MKTHCYDWCEQKARRPIARQKDGWIPGREEEEEEESVSANQTRESDVQNRRKVKGHMVKGRLIEAG